MIHASRPFVLNDWIQTKIGGYEVSGTVEVCINALTFSGNLFFLFGCHLSICTRALIRSRAQTVCLNEFNHGYTSVHKKLFVQMLFLESCV